jgi:lactate dehydrogenase-like 2-hydroxyacid dehydrogenase
MHRRHRDDADADGRPPGGEGERELREGRWTGWRPTHLIGTKVSGATLGIIGFGRIGQAMAQRAHFGFGMKILVQNRSPVPAEVLARYNAVQVPTIETCCRNATSSRCIARWQGPTAT